MPQKVRPIKTKPAETRPEPEPKPEPVHTYQLVHFIDHVEDSDTSQWLSKFEYETLITALAVLKGGTPVETAPEESKRASISQVYDDYVPSLTTSHREYLRGQILHKLDGYVPTETLSFLQEVMTVFDNGIASENGNRGPEDLVAALKFFVKEDLEFTGEELS